MTFNTPRLLVSALALLVSAVCPDVALGQQGETAAHGFLRLVDAVSAGTGKLDVLVDGSAVRPEGYKLGNVTGGIPLAPKSYRITFRRDGVTSGETEVSVAKDETTILIPFAEQVPASDKEPAHWAIKILRLKQQDSNNVRTASFVSVSGQAEVKVEIRQSDEKWEPVFVKRLSVSQTKIKQSKGYIPVRSGEKNLSAISVASAGNHVSVLYDDEKGELQSKTFQDYKYLSAD